MSLRCSVFCDNCEETLEVSTDIAEAEDGIIDSGWLIVRGDNNFDFCSNRCLAVWAGVQAGTPTD